MTGQLEAQRLTPLQLRARLEEMVRLDLLGPAGGPHEEVEERNVRGRYIAGLLAPRGQSIIPDLEDDLAAGGVADDQDGRADTVAPQTASMLPSSIGLTFTVDGAAGAIQITARWGAYQRTRSETLPPNDKGEPRLVWKRRPVEATSEPVLLQEGTLGPWHPQPDNEEVYVTGRCRRRGDAWSVTLFLVNAQHEPKQNKDEAWLFQPELVVQAPDGAPIFVKRQLPPELSADSHPEDRAMAMLYRRDVEFAVGHGVAVHAERDTWQRATRIETRVMPTGEVEQMEPPAAEDIPLLGQAVFDMKQLAAIEPGGFAAALNPLAQAYEAWITAQETQANTPGSELAAYQTSAAAALANCREALGRMRAGIALLDDDAQAALAFRFANRAMHLQRIRTLYARQARQGQQPNLDEIDAPANRSWRPFQLAFLLLNLAGLADPTHPERSDPTKALADLLWFPTGGGKTEAYLGVAAFAMGIRRLQGDGDQSGRLGGRSGQAGVTVLMRYTLRLLTLQQFQRAATLMAACEIIRREEPARWGLEPFRIGLWVGQRSTPNWTKDAAEAIKRDRGIGWGAGFGGGGTPYQITNCPWCGSTLDPGRHIRVETYDQGRGRTFQYCPNGLGGCPFSFKESPDEGLPIVVVDEEIYRRLPTLLIATVDKFAQMPWRGAAQMLFGQVNGYCPRHGYRAADLSEIEDADSHPKKGYLPAVKSQPVGPLRPPDLIIQDELHLISGPLGTLVGLYETAVDELASWEIGGRPVRPKVIASTATIRRARSQVNNLFLREVKIFPPAALDAEDNFFSRRRPSTDDTPGRLYVGICAPGTRLKAVLIRVYVAYMSAAQRLYEQYGRQADPWMTLVGYFNSMRELGGMRRVMDDAVPTRLKQMDQRGLARRFVDTWGVEELTSRKGAADIPKILDRLETPFDPQAASNGRGQKVDFARRPIDAVLATNMISVGVDVSRLGLIVVAGQPKATAEYIQATSRVGRDRQGPGLVCTVYNWARPRDLSHYERFENYHATFYQQVEALSLTPFSPRALDRGLTGVLVSLLRLLGDDYNPNDVAGRLDRQHEFVALALDAISHRAGLVTGSQAAEELVRAMINDRLDHWLSKGQATAGGAVLGYRGRLDGKTLGLLKQPAEEDWTLFTCLNSLRDVEPGVALVLQNQGMDNEP
ncbi:MAG: DISARM system helicase DrmA [Chloroflexi bacterium]|nr:DISARM system helicase DrmA [Chloroflexota bacterium]MCI0728406.1 DISARM system helicase DrmA [Chloroflexota bacterium]